ncbi:MAG: VOC family protein [Bacteroidota bacterium]
MTTEKYKAPAQTRVGHIHLKVSDLNRALEFYRDLLGFEVTTMYGDQAAFLSAGGYHHHIGLNTWQSKGTPPDPKRSAGLFHTAILYPGRKELAAIVKRLMDAGYPIRGASDHGVSEAIYLDDPDSNGVELYRDRPKEEWSYREDGSLHMVTEPLDLKDLLAELSHE